MKDKIIKKITSRKFLLCVIAFVTSLLTFLKVDQGTTESIISLISSFGSIIVYIVAESVTDVAHAGKEGEEE